MLVARLSGGRGAARLVVEAGSNMAAVRIVRSCITGVPDANNSNQSHRAANPALTSSRGDIGLFSCRQKDSL
jgi:hypothetical protein